MKRLLCLFLLLFLSCTLVNGQTYVTTQDINIRNGAGAKFEKLGVIPSGTTIEILDSKNNWGKINFQGIEGFISMKFLETQTSENISSTNTETKAPSNTMVWVILGAVIILLFILRNNPIVSWFFRLIRAIFRQLFPEATGILQGGNSNRSQNREVYCSKCGEIKKSGVTTNTPDCSQGGRHNWKA